MKKTTSAQKGAWTAAVWAAALALAVLINLVVRAIPETYTQLDLSEAGLYSLSPESLQVIREIPQEVTVYYLCETGSEDTLIRSYLNRCAAENPQITWQLKDPAMYPTFAAQYGAENASAGSLILVSGEDSLVLDAAELYEYDYSDYATTGGYSLRFDGENDLTAALYRLTSGEQRHAYVLTGHGEKSLTETLSITLEKQGFALNTLSLLSGTVPEDCDLLILNVPQSDLAGAGQKVNEVGRMKEYLAQGGKLLVLTGEYYQTPNLDELLAQFGLSRVDGIIAEGQADHALYGYPCSLPVRAGIAGSYIDSGRCSAGAAPQKVNAYGGPQKDLAGAAGWCAVGRCGAVGADRSLCPFRKGRRLRVSCYATDAALSPLYLSGADADAGV